MASSAKFSQQNFSNARFYWKVLHILNTPLGYDSLKKIFCGGSVALTHIIKWSVGFDMLGGKVAGCNFRSGFKPHLGTVVEDVVTT